MKFEILYSVEHRQTQQQRQCTRRNEGQHEEESIGDGSIGQYNRSTEAPTNNPQSTVQPETTTQPNDQSNPSSSQQSSNNKTTQQEVNNIVQRNNEHETRNTQQVEEGDNIMQSGRISRPPKRFDDFQMHLQTQVHPEDCMNTYSTEEAKVLAKLMEHCEYRTSKQQSSKTISH